MIAISNLRKRFGRFTALDDISLHVAPGESLALWGANGAGKSTLVRCALGLFRFDGRISVGGIDVAKDGKAARALIGYVPQELGFYDDLGVAEAITYFARLKGLRRTVPADALARVELTGHDKKRVRELSGGMKQRLALAIALLGDPPVLVLDEVTASLDALGRDEFVGLLKRLGTQGRTMLFASHRPEEISAMATRVIMLTSGRIQRECTPSELFGHTQPSQSMKIRLTPDWAKAAMTVLSSRGLNVHLNGVGVIVRVDRTQKATPVRLLLEANIPVEDFDLLSGDHQGGHP
ncbi:MAG: ABC transporter ATP-binding protein [Planctomycetota bacterium]